MKKNIYILCFEYKLKTNETIYMPIIENFFNDMVICAGEEIKGLRVETEELCKHIKDKYGYNLQIISTSFPNYIALFDRLDEHKEKLVNNAIETLKEINEVHIKAGIAPLPIDSREIERNIKMNPVQNLGLALSPTGEIVHIKKVSA